MIGITSKELASTGDGKNPATVEVGSKKSHYLQGFVYPRWLFGISSVNSSNLLHDPNNHGTTTLFVWL